MKINQPNTLSFALKKEQETIVSNRERLASLDVNIQGWSFLIIPSMLVIANSVPENLIGPVVFGGLILWAMVASIAEYTERHNQDEAKKHRQKITS